MDIKALKELTYELNLLYIEDDDALRTETEKLFRHLFNKVDSAANGTLGLKMFLAGEYGLIITDINMPSMNGVNLCRHIREHNKKITIIITSAHDDSNYLLELINIGIDKFILKPLSMHKLITSLFSTCENIVNTKLVARYKQEIEKTNFQLQHNNKELEIILKVLDTKIEQQGSQQKQIKATVFVPKGTINTVSEKSPQPYSQEKFKNTKTNLYLYNTYISKNDFHTLVKTNAHLQVSIEHLILQKGDIHENIIFLSENLFNYAKVLKNYPLFKHLADKTDTLSDISLQQYKSFEHAYDKLCILFKSFLYVLTKWQKSTFETGIKNPFIYDASISNDIDTIILILQDTDEKRLAQINESF